MHAQREFGACDSASTRRPYARSDICRENGADNSSESRDGQVAAVIAIRLAYSVRRALRKDDVVLELSDDFVTLFSTVDYVFFVVSAKRWCWKRDNKYNIVSS